MWNAVKRDGERDWGDNDRWQLSLLESCTSAMLPRHIRFRFQGSLKDIVYLSKKKKKILYIG